MINNSDCLANLLTYTYLFDVPKIQRSLEAAWTEYQRLLDEAEETEDLYTITKARAYLYFFGYFFPEDFGKGAIERRLRRFNPEISFDNFVQWVDTGNIPKQYKEDDLFRKILQFYQIIKDFKNKDINGSYLDEDRFNKIYARIQGKTVTDVYMWEQRKRQAKEEIKEEKIANELKGAVASEGFIRGRAFVIQNEEELDKFPESHILVTPMTTPKFVPAMKKAIGIITDFGGIMSHPAIIAREMKLPCIVGTKYGSLTIQNEDLVELDANEGIVRILKYIKTFKEISKADVAEVGGKGASLGEMTKAGIPVSPGFVVTAETYKQFVDDDLPVDVIEEILQTFDELGTDRVAVRSSAVAEDSKTASWAGQLESYLNVTRANLIDNIRKCWNSIKSQRALAYAAGQNLSKDQLVVAVVIQKMVDSEVFGVMFTQNPVTKDKAEIMVEASFGLGEMLVQGMITPDNFIVDKKTLEIKSIDIQTQERKLIFENGENKEVHLSNKEGSKQSLTYQQIQELASLGKKIESQYSSPQDIEWALEKDKFYILQARPITA